jgi:hypothetical protein
MHRGGLPVAGNISGLPSSGLRPAYGLLALNVSPFGAWVEAAVETSATRASVNSTRRRLGMIGSRGGLAGRL